MSDVKSVYILIGSIFIFIGAGSAVFLAWRIRRALASRSWPWVLGELESTGLREIKVGASQQSRRHHGVGTVIAFRYRYTVDGREYTGSRVSWSDFVTKSGGALRRLQEHYAGKRGIMVYYNPASPQDSVLLPGVSLYNFTPLVTSLLFVAAGIFVLAWLPGMLDH